MSHHACRLLDGTLIASAIGFVLIGGPAGAMAKGIAIVLAVRFVHALLHDATPTIWTESSSSTREPGSHHPPA